jgi:hypothetical protein
MPFPEWLGNSTLGTMAGVGGGFPPQAPTIADIGNAPPADPFDIRYGAWERTRSPSGALPAYRPEQTAPAPVPPPQMMPPRYEELQQPPPASPTAIAQAPPFWQRFLGAFGDVPMKAPARPVAIPTPQLNAFRFTPVGRSNIRGV